MAANALRCLALCHRDFEAAARRVRRRRGAASTGDDAGGEAMCLAASSASSTRCATTCRRRSRRPARGVKARAHARGIFAIEPPPRPEDAQPPPSSSPPRAGISKVRMVTGDHLATAKAIATQAGIYDEARGDLVLEGPQFRAMSRPASTRRSAT